MGPEEGSPGAPAPSSGTPPAAEGISALEQWNSSLGAWAVAEEEEEGDRGRARSWLLNCIKCRPVSSECRSSPDQRPPETYWRGWEGGSEPAKSPACLAAALDWTVESNYYIRHKFGDFCGFLCFISNLTRRELVVGILNFSPLPERV